MILVNPFKRTMSDLDRRLLLVRRAHPELGRLKLALVLISNWPLLAMAILARGSSIVRMGAWLPSVLICASVAGGLLTLLSMATKSVCSLKETLQNCLGQN